MTLKDHNDMKHIGNLIITCMLLLWAGPGCTPRLAIEDTSFRISMNSEPAEDGRHRLYLVLEEGDPRQKYRIRYEVDGSRTEQLFIEDGGPVEQDGTISFDSGSMVTLTTGELRETPHDIKVRLYTDSFSSEASVRTGRSSVFEIVSTLEKKEEDLHHYLFITLEKGDPARRYTVEYRINDDRFQHLYDENGNAIEQGSELSFSHKRLRILRIGRLPAGECNISMKISTGGWSRFINHHFMNDVVPELTLKMTLKDGDYILTTPENPNLLLFSGKAEHQAQAVAGVRTAATVYESRLKDYCIRRQFRTKGKGPVEIRVGRRDSLSAEIRKCWEWSDVYQKEFVKNEGMVWVYKGQEKKQYMLRSDTLYLGLDWNPLYNIRLRVDSEIDNCYINGVRIQRKGLHTVFESFPDESQIRDRQEAGTTWANCG